MKELTPRTSHLTATTAETILRAELSKRVARNPRYSMRAFGKASGISHTVLSLVLSGKRPLSRKAALKLSRFLELDPEKSRELSEASASFNPIASEYTQVDQDLFDLISDWYHMAILSLTEIKNFRYEAKWIASRLGLSELQVKLAMERLERLGLILKGKPTHKQFSVKNQRSTDATRRYHAQLLEKARFSIEENNFNQRVFTSTVLTMSAGQIPKAREQIQALQRQLVLELERKGKKEEVYHLSVQLYPLTQIKEGELKS